METLIKSPARSTSARAKWGRCQKGHFNLHDTVGSSFRSRRYCIAALKLYDDGSCHVWAVYIYIRDATQEIGTVIFSTPAARRSLQHGSQSNRGYSHPRISNYLPRPPALSHRGPIPSRPPGQTGSTASHNSPLRRRPSPPCASTRPAHRLVILINKPKT